MKLLSHLGIIFGILMVLSSNSWFGIWCGLELNMMAFVTFMSFSKQSISTETMLKYFLIQAVSSLILLSSMLFISDLTLVSLSISSLAISLKSAISPLHFWFPQIAESLPWDNLLILMTLQKLSPLYLLSIIMSPEIMFLFIILAISSAFVGAIGGLNMTSLRKLLSFSSINHMGWLIAGILTMTNLWLIYFLAYSLILVKLTSSLNLHQLFTLSQIMNLKSQQITQFMIYISLLSLSGLPPFMGFFMKLMLIIYCLKLNLYLLIFLLVISSAITLYFYLRFMNTSLFLKKSSLSLSHYFLKSDFLTLMINIAGSIVIIFFI